MIESLHDCIEARPTFLKISGSRLRNHHNDISNYNNNRIDSEFNSFPSLQIFLLYTVLKYSEIRVYNIHVF